MVGAEAERRDISAEANRRHSVEFKRELDRPVRLSPG
jgi:hypothetical protein